VTLDSWTRTQQKDCTNALTSSPGGISAPVQTYDASGTGIVRPGISWEDFFVNTEQIDCPITNCIYSDAGMCGTSTFSASANLIAQSESPWEMTALNTNPAGY